MKRFTIKGWLSKSEILVGEGLSSVAELVEGRRSVVIADRNVAGIHRSPLAGAPLIEVESGEGSKSLDAARSIYRRLLKLELDRAGMIIGFGGGVICDLAGFVASTYLRGVPFGFVPTSLLAQVDAAVGGKNALNLDGYKNIVGTFAQPEFVVSNISYLKTLPAEEMKAGLVEAIKAGAIGDRALFEIIERSMDRIMSFEEGLLAEIVERSVAVKAGIVSRDERESGERRLLNFGHTLGHALEKVSLVPHGAAVAIGMIAAARLSVKKRVMGRSDADRLTSALLSLGLEMAGAVDIAAALDAMAKDKKRLGDSIEFVLLTGIGGAVTQRIGIGELEGVIHDLHEHIGIK